MPGINGKHSVNVKHYYDDGFFLFHVIICLLSKLVSLNWGSNGVYTLFSVVQTLREVDSSGHCSKHMAKTWNMGEE